MTAEITEEINSAGTQEKGPADADGDASPDGASASAPSPESSEVNGDIETVRTAPQEAFDEWLTPEHETILASLLAAWNEHVQQEFATAPVKVRERFVAEVQRRIGQPQETESQEAAE